MRVYRVVEVPKEVIDKWFEIGLYRPVEWSKRTAKDRRMAGDLNVGAHGRAPDRRLYSSRNATNLPQQDANSMPFWMKAAT